MKNKIDEHLDKKLKKALTVKIDWKIHVDEPPDLLSYHFEKRKFPNRAVIRPNWNKYQIKDILKFDKKLFEKFRAFLEVSTDLDPQFCFVSGRYIPPSELGVSAIKPFPKGEWCYRASYDAYINHNNVDDRLTERSMLISIAHRPKFPQSYTHRTRVRNLPDEIMQFLMSHGINLDGYSPLQWKILRSKFFLKPSGKPFPKVRS